MIKRKNILKIAIDSPAAAGAGTLAKAISKHLPIYLDDLLEIFPNGFLKFKLTSIRLILKVST